MNKTDLIQKVKALEGLTQDERAYLINLVNTKKKYGLVWEDKPEEVEEQLRENLPVLKEVKDKAIINGEEHPNHILIEGDNLHALTALTFTHEGKIDVIYIDPPYNTGNKDFIYHDAFKDEPEFIDKEHPFRHSTWLSFISKRLVIAKRLLKDDGLIFLSIADEEIAQLKLLCDEIFSEENFISNITRITTRRVKGDSEGINKIHDYVLAYSKTKKFKIVHKTKEDYSIYTEEDEHLETRGKYLIRPLDNGTINYSKNSDYEIITQNGEKIVAGGDEELRLRRINGFAAKKDWCFRWNKEKLEWGLKNDFIIFKNSGNRMRAYFKIYQFVDNNLKPTNKFDNYLSVFDEMYNNQGTTELKNILPKTSSFTYPKPLSLLNNILMMSADKTATILDFFAGSGTTLHATMALNAEDGGNRQCILVTNNENNICEEVTYERNKRVIQGYTNAKGIEIEGLPNNNLRYYKSEFVSREPSLKNKRELTQLATELLCIKEDCYTEQKINIKQARLFANSKVTLLILFDDHIIPQAVEFIKGIEATEIKVYVFSMGSDPYTEDFAEVLDKVTLCALPDAIYKAYQNVLPKKNRVVPIIEEEPEAPTDENGEQLSIL